MKADSLARASLFGGVLAALQATLPAQVSWRPAALGVDNRMGHAMAYHEGLGVAVLFGGGDGFVTLGDTWTWDGTRWTRLPQAGAPLARAAHRMAYDASRQRVVLFGGWLTNNWSSSVADTWEWGASGWSLLTPATSPSARSGHAMVFDAARNRVLLFGGRRADGVMLNDTWEWDGVQWAQRQPATSPTGRWLHGMAYDSLRQRVVLYGGQPTSGPSQLNDTWEWDGVNWAFRAAAPQPSLGKQAHTLVYDVRHARTVCMGGFDFFDSLMEVWTWDGTTWSPRLLYPPRERWHHAAVYDSRRQRIVLVGGYVFLRGLSSDTWEWDGATTWTRAGLSSTPSPRQHHRVSWDQGRARAVLFGGSFENARKLEDTWEWDGVQWVEREPLEQPQRRVRHAQAYDATRGRTVVFGGIDQTGALLADTWEWDGTLWRQRTPPLSPSPRAGHAMAFDPVRRRMLLFGGSSAASPQLGDTWHWDGTTWAQLSPSTSPTPRTNHTLWSDPERGRVLLFGGHAGLTGRVNDTWEWNGSTWRLLTSAAAPSGRDGVTTAFDPQRNRAVLLGGLTSNGVATDTWEWDRDHWLQRLATSGPLERTGHTLVYDPTRRQCMLFGGISGNRLLSDVWYYGPDVPGELLPGGAGCAGSAGIPALGTVATQVPWTGEPFPAVMSNLPAGRSALLWAGTSNTSWAGTALPLDLTGAGLPGCFLRVRPTFTFPAFQLTGTARVDVWIPADPSLVGNRLHLQGLVVDPLANAFGAVLSNAAECVVGAK